MHPETKKFPDPADENCEKIEKMLFSHFFAWTLLYYLSLLICFLYSCQVLTPLLQWDHTSKDFNHHLPNMSEFNNCLSLCLNFVFANQLPKVNLDAASKVPTITNQSQPSVLMALTADKQEPYTWEHQFLWQRWEGLAAEAHKSLLLVGSTQEIYSSLLNNSNIFQRQRSTRSVIHCSHAMSPPCSMSSFAVSCPCRISLVYTPKPHV